MRMDPEMQKKMAAIQKKVIAELKLDANQTKAVNAAISKRDAAMKKMIDEARGAVESGKQINREEMQAKGKKIRETFNSEMKKGMGEAKFKQYEKRMGEEMKKLMDEMRKKQGAGGGKAGGKG